MKKKYAKPSVAVEVAVIPTVLAPLSEAKIPMGGDNGDYPGGELIPNAKFGEFGTFDDWEDEDL